jgi:hypothetical protein
MQSPQYRLRGTLSLGGFEVGLTIAELERSLNLA